MLDGLVGGWLPALRFVYPEKPGDWSELVIYAPMRVENGNQIDCNFMVHMGFPVNVSVTLQRPFTNADLLEAVKKVLRPGDNNNGHKEALLPKHL